MAMRKRQRVPLTSSGSPFATKLATAVVAASVLSTQNFANAFSTGVVSSRRHGRSGVLPTGSMEKMHRMAPQILPRSPSFTSSLSSTSLNSVMDTNWEEFIYNAQSAASDLANVSLDDPSNLLSSMPIMYGAGLLTSVSPCVWGLLPLTMSYISTAAGEREDQQATLPTLAFAAGLASVFCTLGLIVASLGGIFGGTLGTGILLPLVSNGICLAMGMQLLGFVELPLPSFDFLDSRKRQPSASGNDEDLILLDGSGQILKKEDDHEASNKQASSLFRTFLLGGSSAVVASPCATPVLTSILAYVANAQNPGIGALLLLGYTLGYSTPLLIVASTGGQALVELRQMGSGSGNTSIYARIAPWVTPLTAGVLLWYGTSGLLVALLGDPSLAGLAPVLE